MVDLSAIWSGWIGIAATGGIIVSVALAAICGLCNCCSEHGTLPVRTSTEPVLTLSSCGEATVAQVMTGWVADRAA